jgi:anti-sigma factor (TIGR02949 family)
MNCKDALELLYEIIDKEASTIDTQQVQEHLRNCHHCFEIYRVETSVQEFITARLEPVTPTPNLESLKKKILFHLDNIDCE